MERAENKKRNPFVQLCVRIFKHFDTVPADIKLEYYRFYIIANIGYTLGWMIHLDWLILFSTVGEYTMARIQPISIICHVIAIILNRKGRHNAAMVLGMGEVIVHQTIAVHVLGWDAGFQYIIAAITLFPFLKHDGSNLLKTSLVLLCMASYIYLEITFKNQPAMHPLSPGTEKFFNYSNIALSFIFMGAWGLFLTVAIRRTEAMLEQRNRELYDVEKEAEQAEMQRQLDVWERDNEIYRLRNVELKASYDEIAEQKKIIEEGKKRSEELLLNILPEETAWELMNEGHARSHGYEMVTVMFTDFVNFTKVAERERPEDLVRHIDRYFQAFDEITLRHGVEKIKTIGDAYMCAGGLPTVNTTHPLDVMNAAMDILAYMEQDASQLFRIRVGIHTGPVIAGVVGQHKFQYDIWGDTVNVAARMEQHSTPGRINISGTTYDLVREHFSCEHRGKIQAKNKGELEMYFVTGRHALTSIIL